MTETTDDVDASVRRSSGCSLRSRVQDSVPLAITALGLLLWTAGLLTVDLRRADDFGLVSVLSLPAAVGLALLIGSIFWSAARNAPSGVVFAQFILVIVGLFGAAALIQDVPGFRVVYRHVGIIDYIARTGTVDTGIDAHFNWPGFFVLGAVLSEGVSLSDQLTLANWAPVFFNLIYVPVIVFIFAALGASRRVTIVGVMVFLLGNWPGQDYFSPQATAYFIYLLIIGILLEWFRGSVSRPRLQAPGLAIEESSLVSSMNVRTRGLLVLLLLALFGALVPIHQLTPFAVLAAASGLFVFGRIRMWALPLAMALLIGAWFSYMADGYLSGRLADLLSQVGGGQAVNANVASRLSGSAEHAVVVRLRLLMSLLIWGLAGLSWLTVSRPGSRHTDALLLMLAPFSLLGLQLYGGEMAIRVYFFSLPFASFLIASLLVRLVEQPGRGVSAAWLRLPMRFALRASAVGLVLVIAGSFAVTRYGNLRVDDLTTSELATITYLNQTAEPGSLIVALSPNLPWKAGHYDDFQLLTATGLLEDGVTESHLVGEIAARMADWTGGEAYLIVNRGSIFYVDTFGYLSELDLAKLETKLLEAGLEPSVTGPDISIYVLAEQGLVAR